MDGTDDGIVWALSEDECWNLLARRRRMTR